MGLNRKIAAANQCKRSTFITFRSSASTLSSKEYKPLIQPTHSVRQTVHFSERVDFS